MRQAFLFLSLIFLFLSYGEKYTVDTFTTRRSVSRMGDGVIKPKSGKYLIGIQPAQAKPGKFYLRRKFAEDDYGLYEGVMEQSAPDVLIQFKIKGNKFEDNIKVRFYEMPGNRWYKDIGEMYFKGDEIFVPGRSFLFYFKNDKMVKLLPFKESEEYKSRYKPGAFAKIPSGCFTMGSSEGDNDEKPIHEVCLAEFWIGKFEVTIGEYLSCVKAGACRNPEWLEKGNRYNIHMGKDQWYKNTGVTENHINHPITGVSWNDAKDYCEWAGGRLPTEAEWEYAARAGTTTKFYTGDCISTEQANYNGNEPFHGCPKGKYREKPIAVGSFPPNPWGLYDMSGNVWEWVNDWYSENYYAKSPRNNPKGPATGTFRVSHAFRVLRGGSWNTDGKGQRSASRIRFPPDNRIFHGGFRCARSTKP